MRPSRVRDRDRLPATTGATLVGGDRVEASLFWGPLSFLPTTSPVVVKPRLPAARLPFPWPGDPKKQRRAGQRIGAHSNPIPTAPVPLAKACAFCLHAVAVTSADIQYSAACSGVPSTRQDWLLYPAAKCHHAGTRCQVEAESRTGQGRGSQGARGQRVCSWVALFGKSPNENAHWNASSVLKPLVETTLLPMSLTQLRSDRQSCSACCSTDTLYVGCGDRSVPRECLAPMDVWLRWPYKSPPVLPMLPPRLLGSCALRWELAAALSCSISPIVISASGQMKFDTSAPTRSEAGRIALEIRMTFTSIQVCLVPPRGTATR